MNTTGVPAVCGQSRSRANVAAEPQHDLLHDAQPQAGTTLLSRVGTVSLGEFLENARSEIGGNSGTGIPHIDPDIFAEPFE
jgi:hypothetical protein